MISWARASEHRWLADAAILLTVFSLAVLTFVLVVRTINTNDTFRQQKIFNYKIDHSTDKLTCALDGIMKGQKHEMDNPNSQTRRLYVSLGFRPEQIADIIDQANTAIDRELALLPQHPPCPKP